MLDWKRYACDQDFSSDSIHLFKIDVNKYFPAVEANYKNVLSKGELLKSHRFLKDEDAERFIAGRYALRCLLAKFTSLPPASIEFGRSGNKKPTVTGIEFNVSHSQNITLIAISSFAIGIDIEYVKPVFDFSGLKSSCFSREERLCLNSYKDFYKLWTRKEAILKATGEGINDNMQEVDALSSTVWRERNCYAVKTFFIEDQYVFSLVGISKIQMIHFWNLGVEFF